jgi:hypothetical protein
MDGIQMPIISKFRFQNFQNILIISMCKKGIIYDILKYLNQMPQDLN